MKMNLYIKERSPIIIKTGAKKTLSGISFLCSNSLNFNAIQRVLQYKQKEIPSEQN